MDKYLDRDVYHLFLNFLVLAGEIIDVIDEEETEMLKDHIREQQRMCRSLPAEKTRPTWTGFCNKVSDSHFQKQFRMSRSVFSNLCSTISTAIGEDVFRSETSSQTTRNFASLQSRGGLIPGEVKVALALGLLAGGSYLDLMPLFDVSVPRIYAFLDEFISWVLKTFDFPLWGYLQNENWDALRAIAEPFSYSSQGVLNGTIGAMEMDWLFVSVHLD